MTSWRCEGLGSVLKRPNTDLKAIFVIRGAFCTAWKSVRIWSFSVPYFPVFALIRRFTSAFSPNAGKYRPKRNSNMNNFFQYRAWSFKERDPSTGVFSCEFCEIFIEHLRWLLLFERKWYVFIYERARLLSIPKEKQ